MRICNLSELRNSTQHWDNAVLVRTDGLIGDNIVASRAFKFILNEHPGKRLIIYNTYNHNPVRVNLLLDLYRELTAGNILQGIYHFGRAHGPLNEQERTLFATKGIQCYDCGPFEEEFRQMPLSKPWLGPQLTFRWEHRQARRSIALFRVSLFHAHYPRRNLAFDTWSEIESLLHDEGYEVKIFGWDDVLPCSPRSIDERRRHSVYETLFSMAECRYVISTATFCPHYCSHFARCLVYSDPDDIHNLVHKWDLKCSILDATSPRLIAETERWLRLTSRD